MCAVVQAAFPHYLIESEMGIPRVMPRTIDIPGLGNIRGAMVNVGNPHFVVLTDNDDFSAHGLRWQEIGSIISKAPIFKYGTNVEFVRLLSPSEIEFRIFERGCGPTTSSGTGSCAASAAAIFLAGSDRSLKVMSEGGVQTTAWPAPDAVMKLTGPAEIVCEGEVFES
jgi:diaminopimelate epimerase